MIIILSCVIGAAGRQSDGGVFRGSRFGQQFYLKDLCIPEPRNVTEHFTAVPYVFVADDAFALHKNMLKPYTTMPTDKENIFNYRLSRARRIIENCFGILCAKWRIFRADLPFVEDIVQCCVCLHNFLRNKSSSYISLDLIPGSNLENNLKPLHAVHRNSSNLAKKTRDKFADYFLGGQVEWQHSKI